MRKLAIILVPLALAGCGPAENDPGPGGVTVGEAKALDEAAEILDERNAPKELNIGEADEPAEDNAKN